MRLRIWTLLLFALPVLPQAPAVQASDVINLRNLAVSHDGGEVIFAARYDRNGQPGKSTNLFSAVMSSPPVATRITSFESEESLLGVIAADFSSLAGRIVYVLATDFANQIEEIHLMAGGMDQVVATDRDGCVRIQCTNCYSTCVRNIHIAYDGSTVIYATARDYPFYTVTVNGNARKRLEVYQGTLAPSGQRVISLNGKIVFTSAAPNGPTLVPAATDVYVMNVDGSNLQQVTRLPNASSIAGDAVISNTGDWIAFTRREGNAASEIWAVRTDGSRLHRVSLGTTSAAGPSISGDGKIVSFVQDGQIKQTSTEIDVLALQRIIDITQFRYSGVQSAVLSADGQWVAFLLGPPGGAPGAAHVTPLREGITFEQSTPAYAPLVLFTNGLFSAGGTAPPSAGSLMTAYGANLSKTEFSAATSLPLPTRLGGIQLLANFVAMPLQAVTPWQVNAHLSASQLPGTVSFAIRGDGEQVSPDARGVIRASAPEAIGLPAMGQPLLAAAVFAGTATVVDQAHPASANDVLEVYSLGFGLTNPEVEAGVASPPAPPAQARVTPRLRIGGRDVEVLFAGLVPGLAGVYQLNIRVPAGLAPGYQELRFVGSDGALTGTSGIFVR